MNMKQFIMKNGNIYRKPGPLVEKVLLERKKSD